MYASGVSRKRVDVRLPPELIARVHGARGTLTFTAFVERALESALSEAKVPAVPMRSGPGAVVSAETVRPVAPFRAPVSSVAARRLAEVSAPVVPGVVRASSLVKLDVKPIPKKGK